MKKLTLAVFLLTPLMAQPPLKELPTKEQPKAAMSALDASEHDALALAWMTYQGARITVLEALAASKAGNAEINAAQKAENDLATMLSNMRQKHAVSDPQCMWNFGAKKWQCPEAK